jgi:hypothetical protein
MLHHMTNTEQSKTSNRTTEAHALGAFWFLTRESLKFFLLRSFWREGRGQAQLVMVKNCPVMSRVTPHAVPTPAITTCIFLSTPLSFVLSSPSHTPSISRPFFFVSSRKPELYLGRCTNTKSHTTPCRQLPEGRETKPQNRKSACPKRRKHTPTVFEASVRTRKTGVHSG